jgi:hypothetical protein
MSTETKTTIQRLGELMAFRDTYSQLDLMMTKDAWGRDCFYHPHVQSLWDGWAARSSLAPLITAHDEEGK